MKNLEISLILVGARIPQIFSWDPQFRLLAVNSLSIVHEAVQEVHNLPRYSFFPQLDCYVPLPY